MDIVAPFRGFSLRNQKRTPIFVHGSSERQSFAVPKFMMDYFLANPESPKLWKKLVRTCKWFFDKNPIVVIPCLHFDDNYRIDGFARCSTDLCTYRRDRPLNLANVPYRIWITDNLDIEDGDAAIQYLMPRIFKCDALEINLFNEVLSFQEFLFLTPKVINLVYAAVVRHDNGEIVFCEKILESLPKLKSFVYFFKPDGSDVTSDTVKKLVEMEHLKKLYRMTLHHIPPIFDFNAFSKFILENKQILFILCFHDQTTTEEYMIKVKAFVEKLKNEDYGEHRLPLIRFNGVDLVNANNGEDSDFDENADH